MDFLEACLVCSLVEPHWPVLAVRAWIVPTNLFSKDKQLQNKQKTLILVLYKVHTLEKKKKDKYLLPSKTGHTLQL